jgi:hypothetical protein
MLNWGAAGLALAASGSALASIMPRKIPTVPPETAHGPIPGSVPGSALAPPIPEQLSPELYSRAQAALRQHRSRLNHVDRIGIVDFSRPSSAPRFFVVDMATGEATAHLVAHGRGSDPAHTGWLERFSNVPGSYASSAGAYVTGDDYYGAHGHSMRLGGLDSFNSNVEARDIVIHAAWYVNPEIVSLTGKIGRSEGCFAMSNSSRDAVMAQLGEGRLIYADKT